MLKRMGRISVITLLLVLALCATTFATFWRYGQWQEWFFLALALLEVYLKGGCKWESHYAIS